MILTEYYELIDLKYEDNFLLFHTLLLRFDIISRKEKEWIEYWHNVECIFPENEEQMLLFENLRDKGYIMLDKIAESKMRERIYDEAKRIHKERKERKNIGLILSYNCNFTCPYCFEKDREGLIKLLSKEQVVQIFTLNENVAEILLFGGEPLLLEHYEIIEYIFSKYSIAPFVIITNGFFLEEYIELISKVKINYIQVTIDGEKNTHDKLRMLRNGEGTFEKILRGITCALENNIRIKLRINVSNVNSENVCALINQLKSKYKKYMHLLDFEIQPLFQYSIEENENYYQTINKEKLGIENTIDISNFPIYNFVTKKRKRIEAKYCNCQSEINIEYYDPYYNIYACALSVGNETERIGIYGKEKNIFEKSIVKRNIESIPECNKCKYAVACGGGCSNVFSGNKFRPNCDEFKYVLYKQIPEYIREYLMKVKEDE